MKIKKLNESMSSSRSSRIFGAKGKQLKSQFSENKKLEETEKADDLISVEQEFDSAATSINSNKLPAVYSMVKFNPGDVVVDYGGGKFDNAINYLKDQGVTLLVYDPYNRSAEHNKEVLRVLREHGGADAAINSNVLNVIKEPEARNAVLQNIKKITKKGAPIYITVYGGTGEGNEGPTRSGYQLNRKTADYMDEIGQVFSNLTRKGKLITAINEAYEGKDAHNEKVTLYYNDLEVQVGHGDGSGYYDRRSGCWLPDGDDRVIEVDYEYDVDKDDVIDHIDYLIYKEDPNFIDKFETDEEYYKYLEDNFDELFDKYEEKILDKFRDAATDHAQEHSDFDESLKEASTSDNILYVNDADAGDYTLAESHLKGDYNIEDYREELQAYIDKETGKPQKFFVDITFDGRLVISIDWGDWKHEHRYADFLVKKFFMDKGLSIGTEVNVTEDNGSDTYSADHYYEIDDIALSGRDKVEESVDTVTRPATEAYEGTYSDKFRALAKKYNEDASTKDALLVLTNNIIRYCPEEDLKDLWAKYSRYYEKDLNESVTETSEDIINGPASGMAAVMSNLIKDEYDAIDGYNSAIVTAEAEGYEDAVRVLAEIQAEENIHVGQLQEIMKLFDPNADKVEDGRVEGEEQLANPAAAE